MKTFLVVLLTFNILIFWSGCEDSSTDINDKEIPASNVSYSQHIQPVFNIKCVNCHGVGTTEAGLDLTTWSGTIADPRIVVPNEPDNSILIWTIEGRAGFPPMPPIPYPALTLNQIRGVRTWIAEGAQNN